MLEVGFEELNSVNENQLKYAVICSFFNNKLLLVRHKHRSSWEIPGGSREKDESILSTAKRELKEETGAIEFKLIALSEYYVLRNKDKSYGRLFYSNISRLQDDLFYEIEEVKLFEKLPKNLTYPIIQSSLYYRVINHISKFS